MLDGVEANRIIVGAYTDRHGGVCPMLAAHRNGGRTSLASFARAWDGYTGARRRRCAATERELNTLTAMLEASIMLDELPALRRDTGERHQAAELRHQPGWAWLRPFRRLDEYERSRADRGRERYGCVSDGRRNWLRHHAVRRGPEQEPDRLRDVLGLDHLVLRDLTLDPVGHRRGDEARAERRPARRPASSVCIPAREPTTPNFVAE